MHAKTGDLCNYVWRAPSVALTLELRRLPQPTLEPRVVALRNVRPT